MGKQEKEIDVSVAIMTYYHENTISQAIESVLKQKTNYSYEIVVADDCSKDNTKSILKDYKKQYPNIIKIFYNEENRGISGNNYFSRSMCRGRYIATLSGDDYWLDENKLQKQVEFLDANKDCCATVTNVEGRFDDSTKPFQVYPKKRYRGTFITLEQYLHGVGFGTHGMMMRNFYLTKEGRELFAIMPRASSYIDDATECILLLMQGPIFAMDIEGVAYRVNSNKKGKNNYNSQNSALIGFKKIIELYNYLDRELEPHLDYFYLYKYNVGIGLAGALQSRSFNEFKNVYSTIPTAYKKRGLFFKAWPQMICFVTGSVLRKVKARLIKK